MRSLEQVGPLGVFVVMQAFALHEYVRAKDKTGVVLARLQLALVVTGAFAALSVSVLADRGWFAPVSARVRALFLQNAMRTGNPLVDCLGRANNVGHQSGMSGDCVSESGTEEERERERKRQIYMFCNVVQIIPPHAHPHVVLHLPTPDLTTVPPRVVCHSRRYKTSTTVLPHTTRHTPNNVSEAALGRHDAAVAGISSLREVLARALMVQTTLERAPQRRQRFLWRMLA